MQFRPQFILAFATLSALFLGGCDGLLGSKSDPTTDEIFEAGRNEPTQFSEVDYVALFPFFSRGGDGAPLQSPQDVYVGFDEFLYVVDERGLHILNQAGQPVRFLEIPGGATSVTQDRRFRVYVTARRDTTLSGTTWNLPVVYRIDGATTGNPAIANTLWHPFDDPSRTNRFDPVPTDEEVEFTGVAVLADNSIYVSRRGPVNSGAFTPHNAILKYDADGAYQRAILSLSPTRPGLRSAINPADVLTFTQPPQETFFDPAEHFIIAQSPPEGEQLLYAVLSIRATVTPDGIVYVPDAARLNVSSNPSRGSGFLYEEFKFQNPSDLARAGDASNLLFVLDAGKDSLFVFNDAGVEGVPPPRGGAGIPVPVSFGGTGDGARQFRNPQGVAYLNEVVYVADTGNNRISRFRLNTDFE